MELLENESLRLVQMPDGTYRYHLVAWNEAADIWEIIGEAETTPADPIEPDVKRSDHVFVGLTDDQLPVDQLPVEG